MAERKLETWTTLETLSLRRRLLSGSAWALGGKVASALIILVSNALLARMLSPQDLGAYFLALSVVALGALLGSLGLNNVVVRFVAESIGLNQPGRTRRAIGVILGLGLLGTVGVGILYLLFGDALSRDLFHAPALTAATGLVAVWIAVMALQGLLAETFRGFHDIRLATVFSNFGGLLSGLLLVTSLFLLWLLEGQATLATVVLIAAGSSCVSILLAGWVLRRKVASLPPQGSVNSVRIGEVLQVTWPLLATGLAILALSQADLWILGAFRPQEEVAIYGAAAKLVLLVGMPLMIANAVAPPLIAEMYAQGRKRDLELVLRAIATLAGIPAFLVLMGFILFGGLVLGLVFGDYYREGALVLAILSIGQLTSVGVGCCGYTLVMTGHQVAMMVISIISGLAMVAMGLVAVSYYGATGVAITVSAGLAIQNTSVWLFTRFATGIWTHVGFAHLPKLVKTVLRSEP